MKIYFYLVIIVILFIISSCCTEKYDRIIENKDELIKLSLYQDITCNDGRNYYELMTYTPDYKLVNQFIFQKTEKNNKVSYTLKYDSIQFIKDDIIGVDLSSDQYAIDVCNYYEKMTEKIKSYGIKILIGKRPQRDSLELMIYFEGGGRLEYYPKGGIKGEFLDNYKKITEGWYLLK